MVASRKRLKEWANNGDDSGHSDQTIRIMVLIKAVAVTLVTEALERVMEQLGHEDWERNLDGLTGTRAVNEISRKFS